MTRKEKKAIDAYRTMVEYAKGISCDDCVFGDKEYCRFRDAMHECPAYWKIYPEGKDGEE